MSAPYLKEQKVEWKALRVEVNNPAESHRWKIVWEFDEDERMKIQSLIDDLNEINAPVQLRTVPNINAK
jgi:hypothetical protein